MKEKPAARRRESSVPKNRSLQGKTLKDIRKNNRKRDKK